MSRLLPNVLWWVQQVKAHVAVPRNLQKQKSTRRSNQPVRLLERRVNFGYSACHVSAFSDHGRWKTGPGTLPTGFARICCKSFLRCVAKVLKMFSPMAGYVRQCTTERGQHSCGRALGPSFAPRAPRSVRFSWCTLNTCSLLTSFVFPRLFHKVRGHALRSFTQCYGRSLRGGISPPHGVFVTPDSVLSLLHTESFFCPNFHGQLPCECVTGASIRKRSEPALLSRGVRAQGLHVRVRGIRRNEQTQRPSRV